MPLFLLSAVIVSAQIPVALDRLEGRWISGNVISDWHFTDDYALNNRTFRITAGDTTEISRTYIRADKNGVTSLTYVGVNGENHQFELAIADIYAFTWRNVQSGDLPTCLKIERAGLNKYTWNGIGETIEFKREKENKPKAKFGILLGATQSFTGRSPDLARAQFSPKQGFEAAASVAFFKPGSPLRLNIEGGFIHKQMEYPVSMKNEAGELINFKNAHTTNTRYVGILPEGRFGKNQQFSFTTGITFGLSNSSFQQHDFSGTPPANYENLINAPAPDRQWGIGLKAGLGYYPNLKIAGFQPGFYLRYTYREFISAGVRLEL